MRELSTLCYEQRDSIKNLLEFRSAMNCSDDNDQLKLRTLRDIVEDNFKILEVKLSSFRYTVLGAASLNKHGE